MTHNRTLRIPPCDAANSRSGSSLPDRAFYSEHDLLGSRIARLQARCDALRGRAGYHAMLGRLTTAKVAALASGGKHD